MECWCLDFVGQLNTDPCAVNSELTCDGARMTYALLVNLRSWPANLIADAVDLGFVVAQILYPKRQSSVMKVVTGTPETIFLASMYGWIKEATSVP